MGSTRGKRLALGVAALGGAGALAALGASPAGANAGGDTRTVTPIRHLVVVFQENVSFDHYFGTYPHAENRSGEPAFHAAAGTPRVNGLSRTLLTRNPNGVNPARLDRSVPLTCDQDHDYRPEQQAFNHGLMNRFPQNTQVEDCSPPEVSKPHLVMDYYDGNTVTGLWNYAQHYALSDNSYGTTFGPSTPGALNLVAGQTHGVYSVDPATHRKTATPDPYAVVTPNRQGIGTVINDPDPAFDDCSSTSAPQAAMTGRNVGDLLNAGGVSWGWFQGGFRPSTPAAPHLPAVCDTSHTNVGGAAQTDYSAHHEPFEYYRSTSNPHHLAPASVAEVGHPGRANHQYDLSEFYRVLNAQRLPAVSFLKAAKYQDGHAGYSDPLDEQHFLITLLNRLQSSPDWASTAVVIAYDDSDGWYDHQIGPIVNTSQDPANDALSGPGRCGSRAPLAGYQDRCGYGPRLPLLVLSPCSKTNYVDHAVTDQSSILRFIEDNWLSGERIGHGSFDALAGLLGGMFTFGHPSVAPLFLNPTSGGPT